MWSTEPRPIAVPCVDANGGYRAAATHVVHPQHVHLPGFVFGLGPCLLRISGCNHASHHVPKVPSCSKRIDWAQGRNQGLDCYLSCKEPLQGACSFNNFCAALVTTSPSGLGQNGFQPRVNVGLSIFEPVNPSQAGR